MVDVARIMGNFSAIQNEYLNSNDKTKTMLYDYIKQRGSDLSVIRLSSKSNQREEIMSYMKTTYPDGKPRCCIYSGWKHLCRSGK